MIILGLDASSTCIGHALIAAGQIERYGHYDLTGEIARRCEVARAWTVGALTTWQPTLVVIESPVARFAKAVIPQARVSGAILSALSAANALHIEATPGQGKAALTGNGNASKHEVLAAAARRLGLPDHVSTVNGKVCLVAANGMPILTEDEADAIGLALFGLTVRVEVAP